MKNYFGYFWGTLVKIGPLLILASGHTDDKLIGFLNI